MRSVRFRISVRLLGTAVPVRSGAAGLVWARPVPDAPRCLDTSPSGHPREVFRTYALARIRPSGRVQMIDQWRMRMPACLLTIDYAFEAVGRAHDVTVWPGCELPVDCDEEVLTPLEGYPLDEDLDVARHLGTCDPGFHG